MFSTHKHGISISRSVAHAERDGRPSARAESIN